MAEHQSKVPAASMPILVPSSHGEMDSGYYCTPCEIYHFSHGMTDIRTNFLADGQLAIIFSISR